MKKKPKLIGSGLECRVYDLHNGKVYKQYADRGYPSCMAGPLNEKEIQKVYKLAKKAAKHELGPKVYYRRKYGYVTKKVDPPGKPSKKEYDKFIKRIEKVFGYLFNNDIGDWGGLLYNLGRENGKLVLIDFGPASTN